MKWFREFPIDSDIVVAGDSMVERGDWSDILDRRVANRGVGGETVSGLRSRAGEIARSRAGTVLLLIGVNDIAMGRAPEVVAKDILELARFLAPKHVRVLSIIPGGINRSLDNPAIVALNAKLAAGCVEMCEYIDVATALAPGSLLPAPLTVDGRHLSAAGYHRLADALARTAVIAR